MRFLIRHRSREVEVPPQGVVVGRSASCGLRLDGGLVSRTHARLASVGDGISVEDLSSRNGVLVNNRKIAEPTMLAHGDVIEIGNETVEIVDRFVLSHPAHLSTLPPPPWGIAPPGEADVDPPDSVTVTVQRDVLTDRERSVLELIVLGFTQREIAERLHVSVKTVESHRANVVAKLGCRTRADLVRYAISAGLMPSALRERLPSAGPERSRAPLRGGEKP